MLDQAGSPYQSPPAAYVVCSTDNGIGAPAVHKKFWHAPRMARIYVTACQDPYITALPFFFSLFLLTRHDVIFPIITE